MDLIRSWMFVPGHRQRMIDKALGLNADAIMLDIEDGVAPNEKDAARKNIADSLGREKAPGTPARYVRINAIGHRAHGRRSGSRRASRARRAGLP